MSLRPSSGGRVISWRLTAVLALTLCMGLAPSAQATVFTSATVANFGTFGPGVCRGAAVGISGYAAGQPVAAHPTGLIDSTWSERLLVTAVPGPAPDQVGYKVCNIGSSPVSGPPSQAILLAAISADSGQSTAVVEKNFGAIGAHDCLISAESVPGAQTGAAATAQPNGAVAAPYAAAGGIQASAYPGPNADQVTLKACNVTGAAINPPAQAFLLASFPPATPGASTNTSTLTYGQLGAGSCQTQTFGVAGATTEAVVIANPISPVGGGYTGKLFVAGLTAMSGNPNEASYRLCNVGAGALTPPTQNFRVMALHPPPPPCDPAFDATCPIACDPSLEPACGSDCQFDPAAPGCGRTQPRCSGRRATIVGTAKKDTLRGTKKRDVIVGRGGKDTLTGAGGDDLLCGGGGSDRLLGGAGEDTLIGGGGADRCDGGAGEDQAKSCGRLSRVP